MEVENIQCYQEIYNKIKSYVVENQIPIPECLIIKIITLISIYRKFYIFVDEEQIEIDKEYNIAQIIKPMNTEIKNNRILNIIFYDNIYDEIIKLYYIISYRITCDRSNYKALKLTDTEKRYECFNYPNLIFNFYNIIWQFFISNPDSSSYSFYYNFCKLFGDDETSEHEREFYVDCDKYIKLFEDSNFSPVERNKNINLMDNEEYEEMMDLKHHRIQ